VANHKSAEKRVRQTKIKTLRNKVRTTKARSAIKSIRAAIQTNDKDGAVKLLPLVQEKLAILAKTGVIKKNNAARKTSRLAKQINAL